MAEERPNGRRSTAGGDHGAAAVAEHGDDSGQRGRRKEEVSRRTGGSPGGPWRRRRPAGRDDGDALMLGVPAGGGEGTGRHGDLRLPRTDSCVGEEQLGEAEATEASAWLRAAGVGGIRDGSGRRRREERGLLGLGLREGEEQGREERAARGGGPRMEAGREGGAGMAREQRWSTAAWCASAEHCGARKKLLFSKTPPQHLIKLQNGPAATLAI